MQPNNYSQFDIYYSPTGYFWVIIGETFAIKISVFSCHKQLKNYYF